MKIVKLPAKKFCVRVVHYTGTYYAIEYSYTRFSPQWRHLNKFSHLSFNYPNMEWRPKIFESYQEAEQFAQTLKSLEDIHTHYTMEQFKETVFRNDLAAHISKTQPYTSKIIKCE